MDICFCNSKDCTIRKRCLRAIENHNVSNLPIYISYATFKCFEIDGDYEYFIDAGN